MSGQITHDVRVFAIRRYKGKNRTTYTVRWRVAGKDRQETFGTSKLADAFRARLLVAISTSESFDVESGLPLSTQSSRRRTAWIDHATAFVDVKWSHASPRHRKGIAEGLMTATTAMFAAPPPDDLAVRRALGSWAFNTSARRATDEPPPEIALALQWVHRHTPALSDLMEAARLRRVLDALALRLDGRPAAPSTIARKRSALYSALQYAVEIEAIPSNPMDRISWKAPAHTDLVDQRVVVNPAQARALIAAVRDIRPSLEAFFACIYYAALRPSEARHLRVDDLELPAAAQTWGTLTLAGSTQTAGGAWTDGGLPTEDRALKHRARRATRRAPAPPELVDILRRHLESYPCAADGRLFVTRAGSAGVPVAIPFAGPQSLGTVYRVWDLARKAAFTDAEYASPLAKRPYDLRHAAVSLWLNAGVPATQVAEWAGHSVNVLLRVYASCIVGQDESARQRVELALNSAAAIPAAASSPVGFPHDFPTGTRREPSSATDSRTGP